MRRFIAAVLTVALFSSTLVQAQSSGVTAAGQARTSATRNSFQALTSHLDPGGNLFLYISTEEWLKGLSGGITKWRDLFLNMPDMSPNDKQTMTLVFDGISRLVNHSGVEQVSGFGMSSIAIEKDLYRVSSMLHHYPAEDSGYLWSIGGKRTHALDGLDFMPANAAVAAYGDLDVPLLWSAINDEIGNSGIPGAKEALGSLPAQFELMTGGGDLNQLLSSLGGEYGLVVTLDENKMMSLPIPGPVMQIPEPAAMVIVKVKNDALFNMIDEAMNDMGPDVVKTDRPGVRMRSMDLSSMMPGLRPSVARSGDYLFISTSDTLIENALIVKAGGRPGLKSTDEFKRMSQGIPTQGNAFTYMSPKIGQLISRVQTQALEMTTTDPAQIEMSKKMTEALGGYGTGASYAVSGNTNEGWLSVGNMTQNPATTLLLPVVAVPVALAAVAIPNLGRSRQAANDAAAIANLRTIVTAEVVHFVEKDKYADMRTLIMEGLLDSRFNSTVSGYRFAVTVSGLSFIATATPDTPDTGRWSYFVTESGEVSYSLDPSQAPPGQSGRPVR